MRPTAGTRLIDAYEALTGALVAALSQIDVQVLDGPRVAQELEPDVLLVGYSQDAGMTLSHQRAGLGSRIDETFTVRCFFSTVSGDTELTARRARVRQMLDVVAALCALERPLGGVIDRLAFGEQLDLEQEQTEDGAVCELEFSLTGHILR